MLSSEEIYRLADREEGVILRLNSTPEEMLKRNLGINEKNLRRYERLFSGLYSLYEYLRDNDIPESKTSRLLHKPKIRMFSKKAREEIDEIFGTLDGTHTIEDHPKEIQKRMRRYGQYAYEGHELMYWLFLTSVSKRIGYNEFGVKPHESMLNGYANKGMTKDLLYFTTDWVNKTKIEKIKNDVWGLTTFLGDGCRISGTLPHKIAICDLEEMRGKPYLANAVSPELIYVAGELDKLTAKDLFPKLYE